MQIRLIHAGYVHVQVKERQIWDSDIGLALGKAGVHAITIFNVVNMDIPVDENVGRGGLGPHEGADLWVTAPLAMGMEHLWGRGVLANIIPGDARIIAFMALGTQWVNYKAMVQTPPPPATHANPSWDPALVQRKWGSRLPPRVNRECLFFLHSSPTVQATQGDAAQKL